MWACWEEICFDVTRFAISSGLQEIECLLTHTVSFVSQCLSASTLPTFQSLLFHFRLCWEGPFDHLSRGTQRSAQFTY